MLGQLVVTSEAVATKNNNVKENKSPGVKGISPKTLKYRTAKPHSGVIVLMLSYLLPIRWQYHTANPHSGIIIFHLSYANKYQ